MQCPVCDVTLSISSREGVEIDFCPQCRGVWLDRGELDKIIDRVTASTPPQAAGAPPMGAPPVGQPAYEQPRQPEPRHQEPRYDDRRSYDKKKKRRSFLEDIFDFD